MPIKLRKNTNGHLTTKVTSAQLDLVVEFAVKNKYLFTIEPTFDGGAYAKFYKIELYPIMVPMNEWEVYP